MVVSYVRVRKRSASGHPLEAVDLGPPESRFGLRKLDLEGPDCRRLYCDTNREVSEASSAGTSGTSTCILSNDDSCLEGACDDINSDSGSARDSVAEDYLRCMRCPTGVPGAGTGVEAMTPSPSSRNWTRRLRVGGSLGASSFPSSSR